METQTTTPALLGPGEGDRMSWFTATLILKASTPDVGLVEIDIRPGEEPPLHVHSREDEWFYVLDGTALFYLGGETHAAEPGSFVSFPRGIPHTFTVTSKSARLLLLNAPGGFERMSELAPQTVED